jgi:hypothetical protein
MSSWNFRAPQAAALAILRDLLSSPIFEIVRIGAVRTRCADGLRVGRVRRKAVRVVLVFREFLVQVKSGRRGETSTVAQQRKFFDAGFVKCE